jgi:leukocyte elastase inhibitor
VLLTVSGIAGAIAGRACGAEPSGTISRPIEMSILSKSALATQAWTERRFKSKQGIIACCAGVMLLMSAAGGLLIAVQAPPIVAVDGSVKLLSDAYNSSGQELFSRLADTPGNIAFSPYSVGTAMALALSGARGDTEAEMLRILKHNLSRAEIDGANGKAIAILNRYGRGPLFFSKPAKLTTANAILLTTDGGNLISNDYLAQVKANYEAEIFRNATAAAINGWVSRKTEGKIERIVDKELDSRTAAVLVNAIYFKVPWESPFDQKLTRAEPFKISPSHPVSVPFMHREGTYPVVIGPGFSAIRLSYQVPQLHMVIVLPDRGSALDMVSARLDGAALSRTFAQFQGPARKIELALPRFKASFGVNLKEHFRALGMTRPFDRADFSGMTYGRAAGNVLAIDDIVHRAIIEASEEGTEAGAATAVFMIASGPPSFRVDRPFLFYIIDDATGAILFQGRIVDPR